MHTSPPTSVPTTTDPLPSATPSPGDNDSSPSDPPIRTPLLHRALLTLLPATLLVGVVVSAIWGESGLLARRELEARLAEANGRVAELDRDNQRILHLLSSMDRDPLVLERMVADELGWAREGATVYRFAPDPEPAIAE